LRLIVGLGNPGRNYRYTRHNIGFMIAEALAQRLDTGFKRSFLLKGRLAQKGDILLAKPQTFMNLSGQSVKRIAERFKVAVSDIFVICDDLSLPFGKLRLRRRGSAGGHKGLSSVAERLGTQDFARLRIGVGAPKGGVDPADFVLSDFTPEERDELPAVIARACDCALAWRQSDIEKVMAEFN
jgi:PTH1 family peptidyl-tRNA hydrolase